jgi:hypothetical protein
LQATALCYVAIDPREGNTLAISKFMKIKEDGDADRRLASVNHGNSGNSGNCGKSEFWEKDR